jgi:MauM/NapG family ferredoxin protein
MNSKLDQPSGRGAFFRNAGTLLAGFFAGRLEDAVEGMGPRLLRPPGALGELAFLTECTRCDKCIQACLQGALRRAPASCGLAAGTPYVAPRDMPCFLCGRLPCVAACPDGALLWPRAKAEDGAEAEGPAAVRMGVAGVKESHCLTFDAPDRPAEKCRACVDRCPYPGRAITLRVYGESRIAHPVVLEGGCTGCGLCEFVCPAPRPGIVVRAR